MVYASPGAGMKSPNVPYDIFRPSSLLAKLATVKRAIPFPPRSGTRVERSIAA